MILKKLQTLTPLRILALIVLVAFLGGGTASAYSLSGGHSVVIALDGAPRMVNTKAETVGALLEEQEALIDTEYTLEDSTESTPITDDMTISLLSVTESYSTKVEVIPFEKELKETETRLLGEEIVVQEGAEGERQLAIKETYAGGKLVSSEVVSTSIVKQAQNEVTERGTAQPKQVAGMAYSDVLSVKATAYTPYDPGCTGTTSTGTQARRGVIAVDPRVIPYGTRVYVPGYGVATAEDTGGAIKGNRIDVCVLTSSEAYSWGVRNLDIYILE